MRNENVSIYKTFPAAWGTSSNLLISRKTVVFTGTVSPRVNGKLVLQTNPMDLKRSLQGNAICSYMYRYISGRVDGVTQYGWNSYPSSRCDVLPNVTTFDTRATDQAMMQFLQKASSLQANIAMMFAERKKTTDMVLGAMKTIAAAGRHLKGGRFKQAARALGVDASDKPDRDIANQWLQLQYGWRPLLSDVYAVCGAKPVMAKTVSVTAITDSRAGPVYGSSNPYEFAKYRETKFRCSIRADLCIKNSAVANASSFGLTDPASLAWELLPYSFVVDWFLPVGNYLAALHALDGFEVRSPCTTYAITNDLFTDYYRMSGLDNPSLGSVNGGRASLVIYHKYRVPSLPTSVPLPVPKNPFSLEHIANGLALLVSAFRR